MPCFHYLRPITLYHSEGVSLGDLRKTKIDAVFFGGKNCFPWGLVPQLNLELTFFGHFWGHQRVIWQISTGFTPPQSCCNIHHHHLWPSNSHLKHHGSPHVHEGQIAKVHPEPGFQRNLWRNDTYRKETLILDRLRPTSGYHEGYHQTNIMPSALLARPEMFEPFQLPAFEEKTSSTLRFPNKRKVLQSGKLLKNPKLWRYSIFGKVGNCNESMYTWNCVTSITTCFFKGFLWKLVIKWFWLITHFQNGYMIITLTIF